jgi:general nucleoside transport system permease protein
MSDIKRTIKIVYMTIRPSLVSVGIGLFFGLLIMFILEPAQAFPAMLTMLMGGFNDGLRGVGNVLYYATPIILTGLAVVLAFKTGLFNIGASGQMMLGAYAAIHAGVLWEMPAPWHWIIAMLVGIFAGCFWALIPGLLKVISNVNEVVASIMMNYIAAYVIVILIMDNVFYSQHSRSLSVRPSAQLPRLDMLFPGSNANIGIIIAIVVAIVIHVLIHKTTLGFRLRASGHSLAGSTYAGMNTKLNIVIAMGLSGMLAGLAGALSYLVVGKNISTEAAIFTEGFDGISVALLGLGEPIGALFAGLFLSHLRSGGFFLQTTDFTSEIADIIIAVIIYTTAISAAIQLFFDHRRKARAEKKDLKASEEGAEH